MTFTQNWHSTRVDSWKKLFTELGWIGKPNLHFLEIGCFEGQATVWLLENSSSAIDVIDTFEGSPEFAAMGVSADGMLKRFVDNILAYTTRVRIYQGKSFARLCELNYVKGYQGPVYDFIYVDGSHRTCDVLSDAVLSWPLLKPDGILLFDDIKWKATVVETGEVFSPGKAVEFFLRAFNGQYEIVLEACDQLGIRKR